MPRNPSYDRLALVPSVVAQTVYEQSRLPRPTSCTADDFTAAVDAKCRYAHAHRLKWFMSCLHSNRGRARLYTFVQHWLQAYFLNPRKFTQRFCLLS